MPASVRDKVAKRAGTSVAKPSTGKRAGVSRESGLPAAPNAEFTELIRQVDVNIRRAGVLAANVKKRLG